ncbi:MAG: YraN family protein [Pseudomonadota bacterium]
MGRPDTDKRKRAEKLGRRAEWFAEIALLVRGYRVVARRFKTKAGEVDLIARRGTLIVMVEVKARQTLEAAHDAVTHTALRRIEAAGDIWLSRQPDFAKLSVRYDLIAVLPRRWPIHVPSIYLP